MKKSTWIYLALIAACLAVFLGYRTVSAFNTDTAAPEIQMDADALQLSVQASREDLLQGVTAKDNKDGDVTASLVVESIRLADTDGTVSVTYAAFDRAGNVTKASRQVQYTDYESPRFSLQAPLVFVQNSSADVLTLIHATDLFDGDISRSIRATSLQEESINTLGTHEVEFRVTSSLGDTVKLILPVEVYPAGTYQATLKLTDYLIYLPAGADFNPKDYLGSFTMGAEENFGIGADNIQLAAPKRAVEVDGQLAVLHGIAVVHGDDVGFVSVHHADVGDHGLVQNFTDLCGVGDLTLPAGDSFLHI